jgi:hypothetical protein
MSGHQSRTPDSLHISTERKSIMNKLHSAGARALLGLALVATATATGFGLYAASASTPVPVTGLQAVNLSAQSFGIAFQTAAAYTGSSLLYGTSCAATNTSASEVPSNGNSHLINVPGGLSAATTYYY